MADKLTAEWTPWVPIFWWHRKRGHTLTTERVPGVTASGAYRYTDLVTCTTCAKRWWPY